MKFTTEATITGAKSYNNTIDGVPHNFTKIFVLTDLADQSGVGAATGKFCRVYEKGKQLGDVDSLWTRVEVEFKAKDYLTGPVSKAVKAFNH